MEYFHSVDQHGDDTDEMVASQLSPVFKNRAINVIYNRAIGHAGDVKGEHAEYELFL